MTPSRPIQPQTDQLDAQADAFAQLLALSPNDIDARLSRRRRARAGALPASN